MTPEIPEQGQRWTAKRRSAWALSLLKGETSAREAARQHGRRVAELEAWRDTFLLAPENALRSRPRNEEALKDEEIRRLKQTAGELMLDLDIFKGAAQLRPTEPGMSER